MHDTVAMYAESHTGALQALVAQRRQQLAANQDAAYTKLQQLQDQAAKRGRKRSELDAKAARLTGKLATLQVRLFWQRVLFQPRVSELMMCV